MDRFPPNLENLIMVAYEFYRPDPQEGDELVGILPERRKNSERITQQSIMKWGRTLFDNKLGAKDIYYISVTVEEHKGNNSWSAPLFSTEQKAKR